MTDLEATRLCAEAMGWKYLGAVGVDLTEAERYSPSEADKKYPGKLWCLSGGNDWWTDPEGHSVCGRCESIPDPLHDDTQAMALVKRFGLSLAAPSEEVPQWFAYNVNDDSTQVSYIDLNYAIVYCVAAMQQAKGEAK